MSRIIDIANINADGCTFECACGKTENVNAPFVQIAFGMGADELRCGDPVAMKAGTDRNEDCVGDEWFNDEASEGSSLILPE